MANTFKLVTKANVTSADVIYTVASGATTVVLGVMVGNTTTSQVTATISLASTTGSRAGANNENNQTVVSSVRYVFIILHSFVRQRNYHKSCLISHAVFCSNPQVSTNTGILSRKIHLRIVSPEAFILGGDEYHIDRGSKISLVCVIENAPTPPQ